MQELDFLNEANNQIRMKNVLSSMEGEVFVPDVVLELSTRRVLVSEWVDGVKLTKADPSEVRKKNETSKNVIRRGKYDECRRHEITAHLVRIYLEETQAV